MTQAVENEARWRQRRDDWIERVHSLIHQLAEWATAEGWEVEHQTRSIREKVFGEYEAPSLTIRLPEGELEVKPIALQMLAGPTGRVDLQGIPTMSRVSLLGASGEWVIMTDSNVPIREPWNRETFAQLAHDLLA